METIRLSKEEEDIKSRAVKFAKKSKKSIVTARTKGYPSCEEHGECLSIFLAGSPGAGKTEFRENLISRLAEKDIVEIDIDELRSEFDEYSGGNSHLFQHATSILADALHDSALKCRQHFVFDATFSDLERAKKNVERSLKKGRDVQIYYLYYDPAKAWQFTQSREQTEGRRVFLEQFAAQYFDSFSVVDEIKRQFGKDIRLFQVHKEVDGAGKRKIEGVEKITNPYIARYECERELYNFLKKCENEA